MKGCITFSEIDEVRRWWKGLAIDERERVWQLCRFNKTSDISIDEPLPFPADHSRALGYFVDLDIPALDQRIIDNDLHELIVGKPDSEAWPPGDELYDFMVNHEFFYEPPKSFHVCSAHSKARQVLKDGLLAPDFSCPFDHEDNKCPMRAILNTEPGRHFLFKEHLDSH